MGMFTQKKIRDETPSDPFEAELLLMAGMVAGDQKNEENGLSSDSESDASNNGNKSIIVL